ncbi:hypothetical protein T484DRAFT_1926068, partial [Baffinella frigidus]
MLPYPMQMAERRPVEAEERPGKPRDGGQAAVAAPHSLPGLDHPGLLYPAPWFPPLAGPTVLVWMHHPANAVGVPRAQYPRAGFPGAAIPSTLFFGAAPPPTGTGEGAGGGFSLDAGASFGFEGCGGAISYHLGVYEGMCRTFGGARLGAADTLFVGTSSGAIAALAAALGLDGRAWTRRLLELWGPMKENPCFGLLQVDRHVEWAIDEMLEEGGPDALQRIQSRLVVSITKFLKRNVLVRGSDWISKEYVKQVIMVSCFIPGVMFRPRVVGSCFAIDGGFSRNHPTLGAETVLISPARNHVAQIKPRSKIRFRDIVAFPEEERFFALFEEGLKNAEDFFAGRVLEPEQGCGADAGGDAATLQQSCGGRCYYWAMNQAVFLYIRVALFWSMLFLQV